MAADVSDTLASDTSCSTVGYELLHSTEQFFTLTLMSGKQAGELSLLAKLVRGDDLAAELPATRYTPLRPKFLSANERWKPGHAA